MIRVITRTPATHQIAIIQKGISFSTKKKKQSVKVQLDVINCPITRIWRKAQVGKTSVIG